MWTERLAAARIVPIIAVSDPDTTVALVDDLVAAGIAAVEILFRHPDAPTVLARCRSRHSLLFLAAGTILTSARADAAVRAGADLIISPGYTAEHARDWASRPVPVLPGAQTASEVMAASAAGFTTLKFYPAEPTDAPAVLRDYANVFPDVRFVPTGGIGEAALARYAPLRNVLAVGGSWLHADLPPSADRVARLGERIAKARALMGPSPP
jgi:2-dehydro-3-deoxyphosphogluconate aldolase / (4S)-4-hydroxy-2-oxoglutarate aldolase